METCNKFFRKKLKKFPKKIIVLPVTSPCRKVSDINKCIKLFDNRKIDISMVVTKSNHHPSFNLVKKMGNIIKLINPDRKITRRQEFKKTFKLTTVAIVTTSKVIMEKDYIFDAQVGAIEIPNSRAIDIDSIDDFSYCEFLFKKYKYDRFF